MCVKYSRPPAASAAINKAGTTTLFFMAALAHRSKNCVTAWCLWAARQQASPVQRATHLLSVLLASH
jgi:hypothetical protein